MSKFFILSVAFAIVAVLYGFVRFLQPDIPSIATVDKVDDIYDYVIIGSGSAGSVLASRLTEDKDVRVLLLESGGHYTENPAFHVPLAFFDLQKTVADWEYYTVPQRFSKFGMNDQRGYWPRGKVLGGSSVINSLHFTRGNPRDFDEWAEGGCTGWTYEDVLPYFLKLEDVQFEEGKRSTYRNVGGPIGVSVDTVYGITEEWLKAAKEMGYNIVDYNAENQVGFNRVQTTTRKGVRSSVSVEYLGKAAKGRENLHISLRSHVTKIKIDNKRATGVYFIKNNRKHFVKAKREVILSAGAVNSPQILMLSGIGPKKHLEELGIPVVADLPVGENLQDHILAVALTSIDRDIVLTKDKATSTSSLLRYVLAGGGPLSTIGVEASAILCTETNKTEDCQPDIMLHLYASSQLENVFNLKNEIAEEYLGDPMSVGFGCATSLLDPKSKGTIKLKSTDPFDYPLIDPRYLEDKRDVETYIRGMRVWEQFLATPTMKKLGASMDSMKLSFCSQHPFQSDGFWECFVRHLSTTVYHPSCTCKMGSKNDNTAVVDPELKVRGIDGLRVVDASIMPNVTTGNTNAPTIMIAEKASDLIRGINTVSHLKRKI